MAATAEIVDPIELHKAGIKALNDTLGYENAQAFLKQYLGTPGRDYTKWRKEQPEQSWGEITADIRKIQGDMKPKGVR